MDEKKSEVPAAAASGGFDFKLSYDIESHGEKVRVLKVREPTVADILAFGCPVDLAFRPIDSIMVQFMSHLTAVPPSAITKQLKTRDYLALSQSIVARFFFPEQTEGQT